MKRSWLIGAALVFSLTAVGCKDDEEDDKPAPTTDGGADAGAKTDAGPIVSMDGGSDAGLDAKVPTADGAAGDAGDAR